MTSHSKSITRSCRYCRDSVHISSLRFSGSFKVTDFGINRKPVCDVFLLGILIYILSRTVSKLLQIIGQIFAFKQGVLFTLVRGEPLNSGLQNVDTRN